MTYTALPSLKGQVTIPLEIREKYRISKNTPLVVEDHGKGVITIKVMKMIDHDAIEDYENEEGIGLRFHKGIDPKKLIQAIKEIDG